MRKEPLVILVSAFLLSLPVVFAASFDLSAIWEALFGIVFILIFILILLAIGGVLHWPSGGGFLRIVGFLVLIALLFIIPAFVEYPQYWPVPENFKYWYLGKGAEMVIRGMGLPAEWAYAPAIIYLFILPFAGIYTLVWTFLISLGIFPQRNVNRVLALIITFLTIPIGLFIRMVWILFAFMGAWSVAIFTAMFVAGLFFRGIGTISKEYISYKQIADINRARLKDLLQALEGLKQADLNTIQQSVPSLQQRFADVIPINVAALLSAAAQAKDVGDARKAIEQAIREIKSKL